MEGGEINMTQFHCYYYGIDTELNGKRGMAWEIDGLGVEEGAWAFLASGEKNPIYCSKEDLAFF